MSNVSTVSSGGRGRQDEHAAKVRCMEVISLYTSLEEAGTIPNEDYSMAIWMRIYGKRQLSFMLRIWRTYPTPERIVASGFPTPSRQISALEPHLPLDMGLTFCTPPPAARGYNPYA